MALNKKEQLEEILKCGENPIYFIKKYLYIQHPTKGRLPFELYPFQEECIESFLDYKMNIVLKSRQLGLSTTTSAYCLWMAMFQRDANILLMATKLETGKAMLQKIRVAFKMLPAWMLSMLGLTDPEAESVKYLKFNNGSTITAIPTSGDAGRSQALSLLVIDEAAHIDNLSELWLGLYSTLSTGGRAIIFSCVNPNTLVYTSRGIKKIGSFLAANQSQKTSHTHDVPYSVCGMNKLRTGTVVWNNGRVPTRIIETTVGSIEVSQNHKLFAYDTTTPLEKPRWIESKDLIPGRHYVAQYYGQDVWGSNDDLADLPVIEYAAKEKRKFIRPQKLTEDLMYFFGLYIAEGSCYVKYHEDGRIVGATLTITCGDDLSEILGNLSRKYGLSIKTYDNLHYYISSVSFVKFMMSLGFDLRLKAHEKRIPDRLLECSQELIAALVRGMYDGDGTAHSATSKHRVSLCTSSPELAKQTRAILSNFGILTGLQCCKINDLNKYLKKNYFRHDSYQLHAEHWEAKKFFEKIGFGFARKQAHAAKTSLLKRSNNDGFVSLPYAQVWFRETFNSFGMSAVAFSKKYNWSIHRITNGYVSPTRAELQRLAELASTTVPDYLLSTHVVWKRIKAIVESESETMDFSLPNDPSDPQWDHSVIYEQFLGHQTPSGKNFFYQLWQGAETGEWEQGKVGQHCKGVGKNGFHGIKLPWTVHPERDDKWFEEQCRALDARGIAQELNCGFEGSSATFFPQDSIDFVRQLSFPAIGFTGPAGKIQAQRDMHIWRTPQSDHKYVLAADVARGDAADYSAFHIFDTNESEVAAEYMGKIPPDKYADFMVECGRRYNNALIVAELNSVGLATATQLRNSEYPNLYYDPEVLEKMLGMTPEEKAEVYPGYTVSQKNREKILENLEQVIRNRQIKFYSLRLVEQMETFIWTGKRGQSLKHKHDDLIMAAAIGLQMFTPSASQGGYLHMQESNKMLAMSMLAGMSRGFNDVNRKVAGKKLPYGVSKEAAEMEMETRRLFGWVY